MYALLPYDNFLNHQTAFKMVKDKGLTIINLGSSAALHHGDATERQHQLDEAKRFIDLAQQLQCPYVRVFANNFPRNQEKGATMDLIIKGLLGLGDYAKGSTVTVLMETNGDVVQSEDLKRIIESAAHLQVGLLWDPVNM